MATITTRQDFTSYCLRRLGAPVIDINVDDDQVNDRIDDALQYWQDYHFDGLQKVYYIKYVTGSTLVATANVSSFSSNAVTLIGTTSGATASLTSVAPDNVTMSVQCGQVPFIAGEGINYIDRSGNTHTGGVGVQSFDFGDVDKRYLDLSGATDAQGNPMEIVGISRIFPISDSQATVNMFDLRYQLRLNELYDFTSASYINYTLTQQHLRSLEIMFTGEVPIRFQRHMQRLYIDWNWGNSEAPIGTVVVAECYAAINPDVYNLVWNDRWLKEYATALIKRTWGNNLSKFAGLQLPGGVTLDGKTIQQEAVTEIERLEKEMEMNYGAPLEWFLN
jgi:hypothetical protein